MATKKKALGKYQARNSQVITDNPQRRNELQKRNEFIRDMIERERIKREAIDKITTDTTGRANTGPGKYLKKGGAVKKSVKSKKK